MMTDETTRLIAGCPGAGKTTRLLQLVEEELAGGTPPDRIGFVTFGRAAIAEAKARATVKFGVRPKDLPYFCTLHATAFHQLGLPTEAVLGYRHLAELSEYTRTPITGKRNLKEQDSTNRELAIGDRMLAIIDLARARGISLRAQYEVTDDPEIPWPALERFARSLRTFKQGNNLIDFTDMLDLFVSSAPTPQLDVLFVDEAQDLSNLQWQAGRKLATTARRIYVAGDDDQAIFRWSGAAVEQFIDLPGQLEVLEQSYRCPRAVQALASSLIQRLSRRRQKRWRPRDAEGVVEWHTRLDHVDFSSGSWLMLARNRYLLDPVMRLLRSDGLLYEMDDQRSADPGSLVAIRAWERLRAGRGVALEEAETIYGRMSAGVGYARGAKASLIDRRKAAPAALVGMADLQQAYGLLTTAIWHQALDRIPTEVREYFLAALRRGENLMQPPRITVSTIHGAKGREADNVLLLSDVAAKTWTEAQQNPDDELRVFYVAVTRAREQLHIVEPRTPKYMQLDRWAA